ncbi:hypothetical protein ACROAG_09740 [Shewanella oncorhynchi]|uniref:hypothetical protein n=1 Tax=Shewanella oncorhynchi TaxID=2726434 RepID=UPI003D7B76E7
MNIKARVRAISTLCLLLVHAQSSVANTGNSAGLDALVQANKDVSATQKLHPTGNTGGNGGEDGNQLIKDAFSMLDDIKWSQALPVKGLVMMVSKDGTQVLASTDGRILIKGGQVFDGWNRSMIITEANAKAAWLAKIDKTLGVSVKDMSAYYIGDLSKPEPDLAVFVDPLSSDLNKKLFASLIPLKDKQIAILLTPLVNGKLAAVRARQLWCAKDQDQSFRLLLDADTVTEPETLENCDIKKLSTTIGVTQFLQIQRLPYLVNSYGLHFVGIPASVPTFIAQSEKK